jgi:glycosyltransferase involved in cell wall biosynthesis
MNILFLITKANVGGAQIFLANLIKGLKDKENLNLKLNLASGSEGNYLKDFSEKENIPFFRFKNLKRSFNITSFLKFIFNFKSFIEKKSFDIVHLNSTNTLPLAFLIKLVESKTKTVFTVHGLSVLDPNYRTNRLKRFFYKYFFLFFFRFIDHIVFVSKNNFDFFVFKHKKIQYKSSLIYNAVKTSFLDKEEAREAIFEKTGFEEDDFLIVSIGRLADPKNYEFLINNFSEVLKVEPKAKLVLIGDGPKKKEYRELIEKRNLKEKIFLWGEEKDASKYLKAFDLFVLASIYEGLSISLIEALFSDIKIIASKVGGNQEVIGRESCYNLNDLDDFLETLKRVLDSEQKDYTGYKEKFSLETMIDKYIDIYNKKFYDKRREI